MPRRTTPSQLPRTSVQPTVVGGVSGGVVKVGFVPLIDAAPLIAAFELGYFEKHGVRVSLERQIGWANLRDRLTYGQLDAAHALLGMPLSSAMDIDWLGEPLVSVMELGRGGNAITLSRSLIDAGVRSGASFAKWVKAVRVQQAGRIPTLAHVFGCSMHHYLLREWLTMAGLDPDMDVRLCVIPPPQMAEHLSMGLLDGFCVGDPWNTLAELSRYGAVVTPTADILPNHPEKVLAVTRRWASNHGPAVVAVIGAVLEACAWCENPDNHSVLAKMLSHKKYIALPPDVLSASLRIDRSVGVAAKQTSPRPMDWRMRSFDPANTFPSATHSAWLAEQMIRWGHAPSDTDVIEVARASTDSRFYREAAAGLGIACPADDLLSMPLRHAATYDPHKSPYRVPLTRAMGSAGNISDPRPSLRLAATL